MYKRLDLISATQLKQLHHWHDLDKRPRVAFYSREREVKERGVQWIMGRCAFALLAHSFRSHSSAGALLSERCLHLIIFLNNIMVMSSITVLN